MLVVLFTAALALRDSPILSGGKTNATDAEASRKHSETRPSSPCASDVLTGGDCDQGPPVDIAPEQEDGAVNEVGWLGALVEFLSQPDRVQRASTWWRGLLSGARASLKSNRTYDKGRMSRDQKDFHKPRAPRADVGKKLSRDQKDYRASVLETDSSGNIQLKPKQGSKLSRDQKDYAKAKPAPKSDGKFSRDQKDYAREKPAPKSDGKLSRDQKDYAKEKPAPKNDGSKLSRDQKNYAKEKPAPTYDGKLSRDQKDFAKEKPVPVYNAAKMSRDQKDFAKGQPEELLQ